MILMVLNVAFETIGLSVLMPIMDIFSGTSTPNFVTLQLQRLFQKISIEFSLLSVLLFFFILIICKNYINYLSKIYSEIIRRKIFVNLSLQAYGNIMNVAYSYFHSRRKSDINIELTYTGQAAHSSYECLQLLATILLTLGYFIFLIILSYKLSIIIMVVGVITSFLFSRYTLLTHKVSKKITELKSNFGHHALEAVESIKIVKSYCNEKFEIDRYAFVLKEHEKLYYNLNKKLALISMIKQPLNFGILIFIILLGANYFKYTFSLISVYLVTLYKFLPMAQGLLDNFIIVVQKLPVVNMALDLLRSDNKPYIKSGEKIFSSDFKIIEFCNVSFSYTQDKIVLDNVNIIIEKNKTTAIVGKSGGGKSTFADLLLRYYDPANGQILIDGTDLKEFNLSSYLKNISIVTQDVFIFNDTVENNIKYGKLDADFSEIQEAVRMAYCDDFINALPDKYQTKLGDRGVKLSGGQKQRISLARALLKNSPILVLDEATSALDTESEKMIQKAINDLSNKKTIVVIAHRLSTIINADKIIVIEEGKKVEEGAHQFLLDNGKYYKNYYELQFG